MIMASKLVAPRGGKVLLVKRRADGLWMFPGGRRKAGASESSKRCLRREMREELPDLELGPFKRWATLRGENRHSGRMMSDAVFLAERAKGRLTIGDEQEIVKAEWRRPWGLRLTPTSRHIRDELVEAGYLCR